MAQHPEVRIADLDMEPVFFVVVEFAEAEVGQADQADLVASSIQEVDALPLERAFVDRLDFAPVAVVQCLPSSEAVEGVAAFG